MEAGRGKGCVQHRIEGGCWERQEVCSAQDRGWRLGEPRGVLNSVRHWIEGGGWEWQGVCSALDIEGAGWDL